MAGAHRPVKAMNEDTRGLTTQYWRRFGGYSIEYRMAFSASRGIPTLGSLAIMKLDGTGSGQQHFDVNSLGIFWT